MNILEMKVRYQPDSRIESTLIQKRGFLYGSKMNLGLLLLLVVKGLLLPFLLVFAMVGSRVGEGGVMWTW